MLNNKNSYKGYMIFITTVLIVLGLTTSTLRSYADGTLNEHFLWEYVPEQTAQIQQALDNNPITQMKNMQLEILERASSIAEQSNNRYR